jgi:hypothetical protein
MTSQTIQLNEDEKMKKEIINGIESKYDNFQNNLREVTENEDIEEF